MKNDAKLIVSLAPLLVFSGCISKEEEKKESTQQEGIKMKREKTASGLEYEIIQEGSGNAPKKGQTITVHYTGWINENGKKGKKFDSSVDRGMPFQFTIGIGQVIKGWDEGVMSMKVGEKRTLFIPSVLGYGSRGAGAVIKPNDDLIFDVELLGIK
jgi:peptidylprolyl isomerase